MQLNVTRRRFVQGSLGGLFAWAVKHHADHLFAADSTSSTKRCVVLWMGGGPSQMDTFDPKPGAATGGPIETIDTAVPGVRIASSLPQVARRLDQLSVIRGLTSPEGDHERGMHYLHTGYPFVPALPRPTLGSIVSHENPVADFPMFVSIGARGLGPAYMGPDHAPFAVEDPQQAVSLITGLRKQRSLLRHLDDFNRGFDREHLDAALERRRSSVQRVERMLTTPFVKALDVSSAAADDQQRYGSSQFGQRCLLAKRLLESGVKFVEINHDGWDTHSDNFNSVAGLCSEIDGPWSTLMDDLRASGLWDDTILVWLGEFGRTPQINGNSGRDHFPKVTPVVLGGGGLRGGQVIGRTDRHGLEIEDGEITVPDLFATLLQGLGIHPAHEFRTDFGAIAPASDHGKPIASLLS
jgi:uncharacterized protein (DUF1501 family)